MPSSPTAKRLERAQERYKRDFNKGVASVNRNRKAGERALLDVRGTPAEQTFLGRRRTKLDSVGSNTVLANDVSTIALDDDRLLEPINSDLIPPVPSETDICREKAKL